VLFGHQGKEEGAKGHMENMVDVKLAMGLGFRVFFLSALDPIHLYEKKMNENPDTNFGLYYACFGHAVDIKRHNMPPSVHYTHKVCIIRHKIMPLGSTIHFLVRQLGSQEKKKQSYKSAIRSHC
jgi:hypothetical protein